MKTTGKKPAAAADGKQTTTDVSRKTLSRREFLAGSAAVGAMILTKPLFAAAQEKTMKKTFTILHTDDMHSALIGMGPASDYTPFNSQSKDTWLAMASRGWSRFAR